MNNYLLSILIILKVCTIFGTYVKYIVFVSLSAFARHTSHRRIKKATLSDCLFLVRTTGLVVSEASVIAERANLFADVKRQLHSVQGHTECADNALHCHKSCCKPRYEKTNRISRFVFVSFGAARHLISEPDVVQFISDRKTVFVPSLYLNVNVILSSYR